MENPQTRRVQFRIMPGRDQQVLDAIKDMTSARLNQVAQRALEAYLLGGALLPPAPTAAVSSSPAPAHNEPKVEAIRPLPSTPKEVVVEVPVVVEQDPPKQAAQTTAAVTSRIVIDQPAPSKTDSPKPVAPKNDAAARRNALLAVMVKRSPELNPYEKK